MIYIFGAILVASLIKKRDELLSKKRNLAVFIALSAIGIALGAVHMIRPYVPSIAYTLEKYLR